MPNLLFSLRYSTPPPTTRTIIAKNHSSAYKTQFDYPQATPLRQGSEGTITVHDKIPIDRPEI
jgi:hypothetical protein